MASAPETSLSLPPGWDYGRDLLVLVGRGGEGILAALAASGQERILRFAPGGPPDGEEGLLHASVPGELVLAVLGLRGVPPRHVVLPPTGDPWATRERRQEAARALRDALHSRRLQARTVARFGVTWLRQGLENLDLIARIPSVDALRGAFAARPCIIASPGPSLARNVAQLPALRGRALLLAGTHGLGPLQRAGVVPHLVVAADPGDLARHCEGIDLGAVEALAVGATCRRESFLLPARRTLSFASNGELDGWIYEGLEEDAGLETGGSVACSAFSLALAMGCDPIVFVGQDLSFPDGAYYASGCVDADARVTAGDEEGSFVLRKPPGAGGPGEPLPDGGLRFTLPQRLGRLPGYHGGEVLTSAPFQAFHTWFVARVGALRGRPRVFNCTEGGAFVAGMEHVPLAEVAREFDGAPLDVGATLDEALARVPLAARRLRFAARLRAMVAALDPCLELARRCTAFAEAAESDPARLEDLGRAEQELTLALRPVRLLSLVAQDEILRAQEEGCRASDLAASLAASRALFAVVERAVSLLRDPLRRTLEGFEGE